MWASVCGMQRERRFQIIFLMKMFEFLLQFHWSFSRDQLIPASGTLVSLHIYVIPQLYLHRNAMLTQRIPVTKSDQKCNLQNCLKLSWILKFINSISIFLVLFLVKDCNQKNRRNTHIEYVLWRINTTVLHFVLLTCCFRMCSKWCHVIH